MNFIFDIGNVLVNYYPFEHLKSLFTDEKLAERINEAVFKSPDWLRMDHGFLSAPDATDLFCKREPDIQNEIRLTMKSVNGMFTPIQETIDLLPKIKEAGHKIYFLSNMQHEIRDYLVEKYEFFKLFDGGVYSCDINHIKPSPEIYQFLLNAYNLNPKDCLFFDDMQPNITAAEEQGIKSFLFTTADILYSLI